MQHLMRERARLAARRLARRRGARPAGTPRARSRARTCRAAGLGHRPRRRDPRARHRARGRGADPRPARAQGGAAQRRAAGGGLEPPVHARRHRRRRAALRARRRRGRRSARWRPRSAPRAPAARSTTWPAAPARPQGFLPGAHERARRQRGADAVRAAARRPARRGRRRDHLGRARARAASAAAQAVEALLAVAGALGIGGKQESGLIGVPPSTNGRGLREVGCLPGSGPGLADADGRRRSSTAAPAALLLVRGRRLPEADARARPTQRDRLRRTSATEALDEHADVVFPRRVYAEKEGTVTHPDGRLQRVRQALGHAGRGRAPAGGCSPSCASALGAGHRRAVSSPTVTARGGRGGALLRRHHARRDRRPRACAGRSARPRRRSPQRRACRPTPLAAAAGRAGGPARSAPRPSLWAGPEVEHSPSLRFLATGPRVLELSPEDAARARRRASGDEVRADRRTAQPSSATVVVRTGVPAGSVFLVAAHAARRARPSSGRARRWPADGPRCSRARCVLIVKSIVIFAFVLGIVPIILLVERKLLGPLPVAHRPEPGRPPRPPPAARRRAEAALQGAVHARDRRAVDDGHRAGDLDRDRGRDARDHPLRARTAPGAATSASTASTSRSASSTSSPSARSRSTG